jgi:hypothetical protein
MLAGGVAEGGFVIAHGRFCGYGRPAAWIAADVVRIERGKAGVPPGQYQRSRFGCRSGQIAGMPGARSATPSA